MNFLCLDTSTEACTVALCRGDEVSEYFEIAPRRHGDLLLPAVHGLLHEADWTLKHLDGIAYGCGPGAFTGVRLSVAAAQGLALAADLPMVPISTLATLAQQFFGQVGETGAIVSAIDARMGEVYAGAFGCRDGDRALRPLTDEMVVPPSRLVLPAHSGPWYGAGSGWRSYASEMAQCFATPPVCSEPDALPHAGHMPILAQRAWAARNLCWPHSPVVSYLRNRVVQSRN